MTYLKIYGRIFYGIGIAGVGLMHFFYPGFRRIICQLPIEATPGVSLLIHVFAMALIANGLLIAFGKYVKPLSIILGYVFLLFLLFGHLPVRLQNHPGIMAYWTDTIKLMALSGGAFISSLAFFGNASSDIVGKLGKIAPIGRYLFGAMLLIFGIGHFLNAVPISGIVPKYIPWKLFWTYLGGIALAGSGIAFLLNFKIRTIGLLLASVLFIWLLSLHIYYAVRFPNWNEGENFMGSFVCLAFCGTALSISRERTSEPRI